MPLRPKYTEEELLEIYKRVQDDLEDDLTDRASWLERRARSIEDWLAPEMGPVDYPWEDASNITPPIIAKAVRTVLPRILNAFFGADPFVHAMPVNPTNRDDAEAREGYLNFNIKNRILDFHREISTWVLDHLVHGNSPLMVWWEAYDELQPEWRIVDAEIENPVNPGEIVRLSDRMILSDLFAEVDQQTAQVKEDFTARALGNHKYLVKHMVDGYRQESTVTIDREDEELREGKASVTIEGHRKVGRLRVRTLDLEDLAAPSSSTGFQPEQAQHVHRILWLYPEDIEALRPTDFTHLQDADMTRLETLVGGEFTDPQNTDVKQMKDATDGIDSVHGLSGLLERKIQVVESYYTDTLDGKRVEMIYRWIPALRKIAGWDYLRTKFRHGRRPFILLPFLALANRLYALGIGDLLANVQAEAKIIFNQANNREDLINNPVLLIEQNAGINPNVFKKLPPGSTVTVRNVDRVKALEWAKDPHSGLAILPMLFAFGEQIAGVGDLQQGVVPNRPNAPRTARGTMALISEGNIILDMHVMTAQEALRELIHQIDELLAQYMPEEDSYSLTGKTEVHTIRRDQMQGKALYYFTGNTVNTNAQQQQGVAQFLYQNLVQTPFFTGTYLQMPLMAIQSLHRLIDYFTKMHLPGKDASFLLPTLDDLMQSAQQFQNAQAQAMAEQQQGEAEAGADAQEREFDIEEAKVATDMIKVMADHQAKNQDREVQKQQGGSNAGTASRSQ